MLNLQFIANNTFFTKHSINLEHYFNQVNTLVKMFNCRSSSYKAVYYKSQLVAYTYYTSCIVEQVIQSLAACKKLLSRTKQEAACNKCCYNLFNSLYNIDRARVTVILKKAKLQLIQIYSQQPYKTKANNRASLEDITKAKKELKAAKEKYKSIQKFIHKQPTLNPQLFQTIPNISKKGLSVSNPQLKKDTATAVFKEMHTKDDTNLQVYQFCNSYVISYPKEVIDKIIGFNKTDQAGKDSILDLTFAVGGGTALLGKQNINTIIADASNISSSTTGPSLISRGTKPTANADKETIDITKLTLAKRNAYKANKQQAENYKRRMH